MPSSLSKCLRHAKCCVHSPRPQALQRHVDQDQRTIIDFGCGASIGEDAPRTFTLAHASPDVAQAFYVAASRRAMSPQRCCPDTTDALEPRGRWSWGYGIGAADAYWGAHIHLRILQCAPVCVRHQRGAPLTCRCVLPGAR